MPPRKQPSNRIQVDLKLLQDKNAEKLVAFGNQFEKSVLKLAKALSDFGGQGFSTGGEGGGGGGPRRAPGQDMGLPTARQAGEGPSSNPNQPDDSLERQFVRAQKRIGEIPVGIRQALGYLAEGELDLSSLGGVLHPASSVRDFLNPAPEDGKTATQIRARKASDAMFAYEAIKANVKNLRSNVQAQYSSMNDMTGFGLDAGRSREGGIFGLGSEAWREGFKSNLKVQASSWFGFNPNYSSEQATKARSIVNSYGYSGDQADYMAESLKQLEIHKGIKPEVAMKLTDPVARFGMSEFGQLEQVLKAIPSAAKAARMNLQQFQEELIATSSQLAESTSMTQVAAAAQIASATSVTGLSPEKVGAMLGSQTQTYMAMSLTGASYSEATIGPKALGQRFIAPMKIANDLARGHGFNNVGELKQVYSDMQAGKEVSPQGRAALDALMQMHDANPELFGNLNVKDIIFGGGQRWVQRTEARSMLQQGRKLTTDQEANLAQSFGGAGMKKDFLKHQADYVEKLNNKDHALIAIAGHGLTPSQRATAISQEGKKYLTEQMDKKSRTAQEKRAAATIGLSPEAQKWFKILQGGWDPSKKNRGPVDSFAHWAISNISTGVSEF